MVGLGALAVICVSVVISNNLHARPIRKIVELFWRDLDWHEIAIVIDSAKLARCKRIARALINDGDGLIDPLFAFRSIDVDRRLAAR